jgi:hypothetical protein
MGFISTGNLGINWGRIQFHVQDGRGIVKGHLEERHDAGDETSTVAIN